MDKLNTEHVQKIINLQHPDGSWGRFHSLGTPTKDNVLNTEQALRRLLVLGLTKEDEPIKKALNYMKKCLARETLLPDPREKVMNWDVFEAHMLATWIRLFEPDNAAALETAYFWAEIISYAFQDNTFDSEKYEKIYRQKIPILHAGERLIGLSQFYMANLLQGVLSEKVEKVFVDYIINYNTGIYYIYSNKIADVPETFASKQASRYLAALECLAGYKSACNKLSFVLDWLHMNMNEANQWDMGSSAKDGIYFPISESWRKAEYRINDCTKRIEELIEKLLHLHC